MKSMKAREFKRFLESRGVTFKSGRGGHLKAYLSNRRSVVPMHAGDLKTGLMKAILKQLGIDEKEIN